MDKKTLTYIGIGVGGIVVVIVLITVLANIFTGNGNAKANNYSGLEEKLVSAAKEYYKQNGDFLPTTDGSSTTITSEKLVESGKIKSLSSLYKDDTCTGEVKVINNGGYYIYIPKLNCANYKTESLSSIILSQSVTTGDGLYSVKGEHIFKGEYVNNYVSFSGKIWRIIKLDSEGNIKIYLDDKKLSKVVWDDRYNTDKGNYNGKNIFDASRIKESLIYAYNNNEFIKEEFRPYLISYDWCIGNQTNSGKTSDLNLCNKKYQNLYIGLFDISDFANASLETTCTYFDDEQCVNYNYLANLEGTNWTMTSYESDSYQVYTIDSYGISYSKASSSATLRPVVYLNKDILLTSGTGTEQDPYIIK